MKDLYEVKAYGNHGVYAEVVEAENAEAAIKIAKPILKKLCFGKVRSFTASKY